MDIKENTISILVNNKPDVMARIAGTFSGRGFNIETIAVNVTDDPQTSKIIMTVWGNQDTITKIEKQLNKMVDVLQVDDFTGKDAVRREMMLIRIKVPPDGEGAKLMQIIDTNRWKVVSGEGNYCIIEVTGDRENIEKALAALKPFGFDDLSRTGTVALARQNGKTRR
jgi:acetolactate synthase-1/3 small subunit